MSNKFIILLASLSGLLIKALCYLRILRPNCGLNNSAREKKLIVSLTSYGRRVSKTVGYTIISLLRQTYKPDEIILWLDNVNWNENNIPPILRRLTKYGLTIMFCEDIRSYKKLVPTLNLRPNCLIITTDDDVFYRRDAIERLVKKYEENPQRVYCHYAHGVKMNKNNTIASYSEWEEDVNGTSNSFVFPVGEGCVLYDPNLLYKDITNEDLFIKLAPIADDVWFYFMEVLNHTECCQLKSKYKIPYWPLDLFYQRIHQGSSLRDNNVGENMNDKQIQNIVDYYGIEYDFKSNSFSCTQNV